MNFEEKYASNSEEKILIRKIDDLIKRSEKNYTALYSHFLGSLTARFPKITLKA